MSQRRGRTTDAETLLADFDPTPYQGEFLRADKRYLGFVSGVGAGKTFAGIMRMVLNMQRWNAGEMGAIVAPTRQMVVNVILPELRDLGLLECWEHKSSHSDEPGLHAPNGSRALILSADNNRTIERLRGLNLAWGWMDERTAIPERAQDILMQRLRTGEYRNLFVTTTPSGKDDTYDFFVGDSGADKSDFGDATLYEAGDRLAVVGVPTDANPYTPDDYKEAMASDLPDEIRAQEVQGEFVEISQGVLTRDMLEAAPMDKLDSSELTFHVGVDVGVTADSDRAEQTDSDYWAAAILAHHPRHGEAFLVDVQRKRGMTLNEGVAWLQSVVADVPRPNIGIEQVQAQRFFLQACKDANLPVHGVDQTLGKEDRILQMSVPFERGDVRLVNFETPPSEGLDDRWDELVNEWLAFPEGRHIDLVDATEIALRQIDLGGRIAGVSGDMYGGQQ